MEILTIASIIVGIIVFLSLGRILIHSMKALLVVFVIIFGLVFMFGVSYTDLLDLGAQFILWVF